MPRHRFGGGVADFVVLADGTELLLGANVTVTFWDAPTAGNRYEDLRDLTGATITSVQSDANGALGEFDGPDDDVREMWTDANGGAGPRRRIIAADLGADVVSLQQKTSQMQTTVDQHQTLLGTAVYGLLYDAGAAAYPPIPSAVAGRRLLWIGPAVPAAARPGDLHIKTFE